MTLPAGQWACLVAIRIRFHCQTILGNRNRSLGAAAAGMNIR